MRKTLLLLTASSILCGQTRTEVPLHAFHLKGGYYTQAGLLRDSAGNLFGTTQLGGPNGSGVVFKVDETGNYRALYSFTGGADGARPQAGLIQDPEGNLYGTTYDGGIGSGPYGVVFKVDRAGKETVLYSFTTAADGGGPSANLVRDSDGNLYGTAVNYGVTATGGIGGGVVFKLDRGGNYTVLYTFTGGADGDSPLNLIRDSAGDFYGITVNGGSGFGNGVIFKLDAGGTETVLHAFTGGADGIHPYSLIRDSAGNLYGVTPTGGDLNACEGQGCGVVFKVDSNGVFSVVHTFTGGADGEYPYGDLLVDSAGRLYGVLAGGGAFGLGSVYKMDPAGVETTIFSFPGGASGLNPEAGVIMDQAGNLYGTTMQGGVDKHGGLGVIYKLRP